MQVSVPDPSLLLNALEIMVRKVLAAHPEVKFCVDLTKNQLQLGTPYARGGLAVLHSPPGRAAGCGCVLDPGDNGFEGNWG